MRRLNEGLRWAAVAGLAGLAGLVGCYGGSRGLTVSKLTLAGEPMGATAMLTPDGRTVVIDEAMYSPVNRDKLVFEDATSGREEGSVELPPVDWKNLKDQHRLYPGFAICDGGRYALAFDRGDLLYVVDLTQRAIHAPIHLSDLRMSRLHVGMACSAKGNLAVLVNGERGGIVPIDLERGTVLAALPEFPVGSRYSYFDGALALSADGSRLAMLVWDRTEHSNAVAVLDPSSGRWVGAVSIQEHVGMRALHAISFVGNDAIAVIETECVPNEPCRGKNEPAGRTLRVWQISSGAMRELAAPGEEVWRYVAVSADGHRIMAYSGRESFCSRCNGGYGEDKIDRARFRVWEWPSGREIAVSPKLTVQRHTCPLLQILGNCTEREEAPELVMDAGGRAVLEFAQPTTVAWEKKEAAPGVFEVFRFP